jgi:putative transposase
MAKWKKAAHVVYQCSYHLVWTPKYRYRILQGEIKEYIEKKIKAICEWKRVEILEITIMPDHIHMVAIIPPKLAGRIFFDATYFLLFCTCFAI